MFQKYKKLIIALIVVIPMLVSGKDYEAEYDKIFGKEEGFTIHTNELVSADTISNSLYEYRYERRKKWGPHSLLFFRRLYGVCKNDRF